MVCKNGVNRPHPRTPGLPYTGKFTPLVTRWLLAGVLFFNN